jgi:AcrR family transcriptional regulator
VRADVHRAVVELLAERTWDELSVPLVAERSGVHAATIYRRWGSISALMDDVVTEHLARFSPVPDTGSLQKDLEGWAVKAAADVSGPLGIVFLRAAVLATRSGDAGGQRAYMVERGAQLAEMFERARARGEQPPELQQLLEVVLAPLYFHALFFNRPAGPRHARMLVRRLLALSVDCSGCLRPSSRSFPAAALRVSSYAS